MRTLQARLDSLKAALAKKAPPEAKAVMARATEDLRRSGILAGLPRTGDVLPAFELEDTRGALVRSADIVESGHLVLSFYRGKW